MVSIPGPDRSPDHKPQTLGALHQSQASGLGQAKWGASHQSPSLQSLRTAQYMVWTCFITN